MTPKTIRIPYAKNYSTCKPLKVKLRSGCYIYLGLQWFKELEEQWVAIKFTLPSGSSNKSSDSSQSSASSESLETCDECPGIQDPKIYCNSKSSNYDNPFIITWDTDCCSTHKHERSPLIYGSADVKLHNYVCETCIKITFG